MTAHPAPAPAEHTKADAKPRIRKAKLVPEEDAGRFNDATLLQIAAVRPDLIPEMCLQDAAERIAPAPASTDVQGLIERLNEVSGYDHGATNVVYGVLAGTKDEHLHDEAAEALAALQSQLTREELEGERRARLVGFLQADNAQQAERIKELEQEAVTYKMLWQSECEESGNRAKQMSTQFQRIKELEAVIMVVREYPDFDSPENAMAKLMDEALKEVNPIGSKSKSAR